MNISEFERDKPKETLKQINFLIAMQQDAEACIDGKWYVFKDEFDKLKQLFLQGK